MGGMAAQIPIKEDAEKNRLALEKVRADKKREVELGHDGTWVAHPGLVSVARDIFDQKMPSPHQIHLRPGASVTAADLLQVPTGEVTEQGLRLNTQIALLYLESWLRGVGCVPLHHLMEDAATAEISRAQIWQWIQHGRIRAADFSQVLKQEMRQEGQFPLAAQILTEITTSPEFVEFLTLPAYAYL